MDAPSGSTLRLRGQVVLRLVLGALVMAAALFVPAGTLDYWQGWTYLAVVMVPMSLAAVWLLRHSPDLVARRLALRERMPAQVAIVSLAGLLMVAAFLIPGFDHRWGWSQVPGWLVIAADVVVAASYGLVFRVQQVNAFASRTIRVEEGQDVIDTGPYAVVRHPMYLGMAGFIVATPLALGSAWALLPAVAIIPVLMLRILDEEKLLVRELAGYPAYTERVRDRLLPWIW